MSLSDSDLVTLSHTYFKIPNLSSGLVPVVSTLVYISVSTCARTQSILAQTPAERGKATQGGL